MSVLAERTRDIKYEVAVGSRGRWGLGWRFVGMFEEFILIELIHLHSLWLSEYLSHSTRAECRLNIS